MQQADLPPLAGRISDVYEALSRQERQLADTVLEHVRNLAGYTATELAAEAKVSKATATRLFRRLGYEGFEAARLETRGNQYAGSPLEGFDPERSPAEDRDGIETHLARETRNLAETLGALDGAELGRAVELLAAARKLFIVGFRDSYPLALYARTMLARVKDNVALVPGDGGSHAEDLIGLGPSDAVLGIGFRRQPRMFGAILKAAQASGTPSVVLAEPDARDAATSLGTTPIRCWIAGSVFDSHAAGLSVLNLLCSRVVRACGQAGKARLEDAERMHLTLKDLPDGNRVHGQSRGHTNRR